MSLKQADCVPDLLAKNSLHTGGINIYHGSSIHDVLKLLSETFLSAFFSRKPRGVEDVFNGKGACASCHVPPLFTEPDWPLHTAEEIGIDDFQATARLKNGIGRHRYTAYLRA